MAIASTLIVTGLAGSAVADDDALYYLDQDGNALTEDPQLSPQEDVPVAQSVDPSSPIVGRWFSPNGVIVRFDTNNGYVENGQLGPCAWPDGNRYFRNILPLSGGNVFSAAGISQWNERAFANGRPTCIGIYDVRFNGGAVLSVNGNSLTVTGTNGGVSSYTRIVQDNAVQGYLDYCDGTTCGGWARDPDFGGAVDVHFYVDGPAGSGTFLGALTASNSSPDVGPHRFTFSHGVGPGRAIYAYGIGRNADGSTSGANPLLNNAPMVTQ